MLYICIFFTKYINSGIFIIKYVKLEKKFARFMRGSSADSLEEAIAKLFEDNKKRKVKENARMILGKANESIIADLFGNDFGNEYTVINQPKGKYWIFYRADKPYLTCTPDRLLINKETGELEGLEIKDVELVRKKDKEIWLCDELPINYLLQCVWYFVVFTDMKKVTLFPNLKFYSYADKKKTYEYSMHKRYTLYREDCEKLIAHCEKCADGFWDNHIVKKVKPENKKGN